MTEHLNRQIENINNSKQVYSDMLLILSKSNIDHELYEYIYDKICKCDEKISKYNTRAKQIEIKISNFNQKNSKQNIEIPETIEVLSKEDRIKNTFDEIKYGLREFTHDDYPNIIYHVTNDNLVFLTQDNTKKEFRCRYDMWKLFIDIDKSPERILNEILENEYNVSGFYTTNYHWRQNNYNIEKFIPKLCLSGSEGLCNYDGYEEECCTIKYDLSSIDNEEELYFVEILQNMSRYRYSDIPYKIFNTIDGHLYMVEDIIEKTLTVRYEDFWNEYANISGLSFKEIIEKFKFYMNKYRNTDFDEIKTLSHKNTSSIEKEIRALFRQAEKL